MERDISNHPGGVNKAEVGKLSWPYNLPDGGITSPERSTVKLVRGIAETDDPTENDDYGRIALWMSDPDVRSHLRCPIPPVESITDKKAMNKILRELDRYYHNRNRRDENGNIIEDDPQHITPIVAVNSLNEAMGVLIIRWKGNDFEADYEKLGNEWDECIVRNKNADTTAYIEGLVVNPNLKRKDIGTYLMFATFDIAFDRYRGYDGKSASELRQWFFMDKQAENAGRNFKFIRRLGFGPTGGRHSHWREFARDMGIPNPEDRDGMEFKLTKEELEELKKDYKMPGRDSKRVVIPSMFIDEKTLRIPHVSSSNNFK